ncbi:MAG: MFS transporter [Candidatus Methylomirabilota bacterium]
MREEGSGRTGSVRWYVLFLLSLMYLVTYMDRVNISTTAPLISKEFGFNRITMGIIFSAFTWAYAMFQVPGGWMGDRFGPRGVLGSIVTYWSAMTALTAHAFNAVSFTVVRFLFGAGEAGAFPTATRAMQLWFTREERGLCQGITHSASRLGAAIVPPLTVAIMVPYGWRMVFYVFGGIGLVWSLLYFFTYRNTPEEHRWVSKAELAHIRGVDTKGNIRQIDFKKRPTVPWGVLLKHPNMWAIMCAYFTYVYCLWIFLSWLPSYLVDYRHFTILKMGYLASLPLLAGVVGDTLGGWLTDYLLVKTGRTNFSRRIVAIIGMLGTVVFIVPAALTANPYTAVYCLTGAMLFLECTIGPSWAVPMDVGGEYSGTVSGMMNMAGNIGGALSPTVFGILVQLGSWVAPFIVAAALLVIGAGIWAFWLNPEVSVIDKGSVVAKHA